MSKIVMVGRIVKRDGWIVSLYHRVGEPMPTIRVRRAGKRSTSFQRAS